MAQKETHKWADFGLKKIYFVPWHLNNPCRQPVIEVESTNEITSLVGCSTL
jgi:hypothetical protein